MTEAGEESVSGARRQERVERSEQAGGSRRAAAVAISCIIVEQLRRAVFVGSAGLCQWSVTVLIVDGVPTSTAVTWRVYREYINSWFSV